MAEEVWLQEPRTVIDEPGAGFHVEFGLEQERAFKELLNSGYFELENAFWEPVGGVIMGQPLFGISDTTSSAWDTTGASWAADADLPRPLFDPATNARTSAMAYRSTGEDWTLEQKTALGYGTPFVFQFVTYNKAGSQTGSMLTVEFGAVWRLRLYATGRATLDRKDQNGILQPAAAFDWMTSQWAPAQHWLWVYQVGPKLVIRNRGVAGDGVTRGLAFWDETAVEDPDNPGTLNALREGKVKFSGEGYIAIGCSEQQFDHDGSDPVTSRFSQKALASVGIADEGSTQLVAPYVAGAGDATPTVTVYDTTGGEWPQLVPDAVARYGLCYDVEWDTNADSTYYLAAVDIVVPRTTRSSGTSGTDILSLAGVVDKAIVLHREGDQTREGFSMEAMTTNAPIAAYTQPNMSVRYESGGVTRFRGYTNQATWRTIADADVAVGTLTLEAEGLWSRFKRAMWPGGQPFDGRKLTDCLTALVQAAGLDSAEYSIVDDPFTLPVAPEGEGPALVYRPGTTIDRILEELREQFFGLWLVSYFRVTDGVFVVDYAAPTTGALAAWFYETNALASAAGVPGQVILDGSYSEVLDQSEQANYVAVIGQSPDRKPLLARAVDWDSIRDTTVFNFVGEVWPLVVADPGFTSQGAVNWVCRSLFDRHRNPRVYAEWRSIRVDLEPGDLVALYGADYDAVYQIKGVQFDRAADGDAADPMGRATYQAEKVLEGIPA